jgi:hypothetical protein
MSAQGPEFGEQEEVYMGRDGPFIIGERQRGDPSWKYTLTVDGVTQYWGGDPWIEEVYLRRNR